MGEGQLQLNSSQRLVEGCPATVRTGRRLMPDQPILLTGYDAKRCARRVHNEWDPSIDKVEWEVPEDLQVRFTAGIEFETAVFADLGSRLEEHQYVDLSAIRGKAAAVAATVDAMDSDALLILG